MLSYISQHYITVPCLKDVFLCGNKYTFIYFIYLYPEFNKIWDMDPDGSEPWL